MVDHTTGSFGHYNPMGNSFSNIGGMYMMGGDNINQTNTPNISSMYGSSAQQFFNPYNVAPAGYGYQAPQQAMHNYGFNDMLVHGIIGKPMELGMNSMDNSVSRKEYAKLARTTIAGDVAGVGIGAGLGAAALAVGGFAGGALGAAALAVPMAISSGVDTHIENYKRTQRMGSIFSNIANSDGTIGLTGGQASRATKMLDKASSKDLMMDSDDMMNALSAAKDSGMLAQVSDTGQIEQKFKQLTKTLKLAADMMGSSDLKAVMDQMAKFNQLGFSQGSLHSAIGNVAMAGKFAGISQQASMDSFNADVMAGMSRGIDARLVYQDTQNSQYQMKTFQQEGLVSQHLSNPNAFLASARESRTAMHDIAKQTTGLTRDMEVFYAGHKAEKEGITMQDALDGLKGMSASEKITEVYGYSKDMGYQEGITNKNLRSAYVRRKKGVEDLDIENDFSIGFKKYKKMMEDSGAEINADTMTANLTRGKGLSVGAIEYVRAQSEYALTNGIDALNSIGDHGKRMAKRREVMSGIGREKERDTLYGKGKLMLKGLQQSFRETVGGYDSAGEIQDYARSVYGNYAKGSFGKKEFMSFSDQSMSKKEKLSMASKLSGSDGMFKNLKSKDTFTRESDTSFGMGNSVGEYELHGAATIGSWAAAGAAIGSFVPFVGTAIGGALGAGFGLYRKSKHTDYKEERQKSLKTGGRRQRISEFSNMNDKDKLSSMMTVDDMMESSGKSKGASAELLSMLNDGQSGSEYLKMIKSNEDSGIEYKEYDKFTESELSALAPKISNMEKKNKASVAGLTGKQTKAKLSQKKADDEDFFIRSFADIVESANGDKDVISKKIEDMDLLEGLSEEYIMDVYKSLDGSAQAGLGKAFDESGVAELLSGGQQISKESQEKASKFVKDVTTSDMSREEKENLFKVASSGTKKETDAHIAQMRKDGKISAMESLSLSSTVEGLFSIEATKGKDGVEVLDANKTKQLALAKEGKKGQASIDKMHSDLGRATGIKDKDTLKELVKIADMEDPVERMKAKEALGKKNNKVNNFSMKEVQTSIATSSIFSDVKSGSDLLASGADDSIVQAKIYDAIERVAGYTQIMSKDSDYTGT